MSVQPAEQIMVDIKNALCSNRMMRNNNDNCLSSTRHIDGLGVASALPLKLDLLALRSLLPLLINGTGAGTG
jgi:hypothetical protein